MAESKVAQAFELEAQMREDLGKAHTRRMRRLHDLVPAVVYGTGKKPVHLSLEGRIVKKFFEQPGASSKIIDLKVDGKPEAVVVKDKQLHPAKGNVMHIDFLLIDKEQALTMKVPIRFENEETAPGVKLGGGIVAHMLTEVEITCKPADLPEAITVDIGSLELDKSIHLSELVLPQGVALAHAVDSEHDQAVVSISVPRAAAETEEAEASEAEGDGAADESKSE